MAIQTASTGNLADVMRTVIAQCLYTEEHNAPCANLITRLAIGQGESDITWPKVGQMDAHDLTDGVEIVDGEDIGVTSSTLTSSEVGLMVTLTKKLVRQFNQSVMGVIARQMGDGMARKKEDDIIAIFSSLNSGTTLGADGSNMNVKNVAACIAQAQARPVPNPYFIIQHPNALHAYFDSLSFTPASTYPMPMGYAEQLLKDWYWGKTSGPGGVPMFHSGNIDAIADTDSAYGVIASQLAMGIVEQMGYTTEEDYSAAKRGWDVVVTADYGVYELDDQYGFPMRYEMGAPSTTN